MVNARACPRGAPGTGSAGASGQGGSTGSAGAAPGASSTGSAGAAPPKVTSTLSDVALRRAAGLRPASGVVLLPRAAPHPTSREPRPGDATAGSSGVLRWLDAETELAFQRWMNEQGTMPEDSTGTAGAVLGAAAPAPAPAPKPCASSGIRLNDPAWADFSRVPPPAAGQGAGRGAPGKGKGQGKPSQKGGGKGKAYGKGAYGGRFAGPYSGPHANV